MAELTGRAVLTAADLAEGRRLFDAWVSAYGKARYWSGRSVLNAADKFDRWDDWAGVHAEALLAAAEETARLRAALRDALTGLETLAGPAEARYEQYGLADEARSAQAFVAQARAALAGVEGGGDG